MTVCVSMDGPDRSACGGRGVALRFPPGMKWTVLLISLFLCGNALADDAPGGSLWDSSRYMRISEVRPGMTGYGMTVFSGTTISKFNVSVVDVIKDFRPKGDLILITSDDPRLLHSEAVEGMSGSPIFL